MICCAWPKRTFKAFCFWPAFFSKFFAGSGCVPAERFASSPKLPSLPKSCSHADSADRCRRGEEVAYLLGRAGRVSDALRTVKVRRF